MDFSHALLTRPRPELDELAASFGREDLVVVAVPAFRFAPTGRRIEPDSDWRTARTRLVLFTSPRTVRFGLPVLERGLLDDAALAAVGPATAHALEAEGLACLRSPEPPYDSESLLAHLKGRFEPGAALILAAPGGRDALRRGLRAAGWKVRLEPVYERVPLEPDRKQVKALERARRVVSVWTSGNALDHLLDSLSDAAVARVRAGAAIVVSERLATLARARGFGDVHVAPGPGNADLVRCYRDLPGARRGANPGPIG